MKVVTKEELKEILHPSEPVMKPQDYERLLMGDWDYFEKEQEAPRVERSKAVHYDTPQLPVEAVVGQWSGENKIMLGQLGKHEQHARKLFDEVFKYLPYNYTGVMDAAPTHFILTGTTKMGAFVMLTVWNDGNMTLNVGGESAQFNPFKAVDIINQLGYVPVRMSDFP